MILFRSVVVFATLVIPALSFADGFRCEGDGYKVKVYNQTDPSLGTRTPAVMVISSEEDGVITVIKSDKIQRKRQGSDVVYFGEGNQGSLAAVVQLKVANAHRPEGDTSKTFESDLSVSMSDGYKINAELQCTGYLKSPIE